MKILVILGLLAASPEYRRSLEQWRERQEALLRSDSGWLTVAGLTWLKEGMNEIELPPEAPRFGKVERRGNKVFFHPAEGGPPQEMKPDASGAPTVITRGSISVHVIQRGERLGIRLKDTNSVFRREFTGRRWYPVKEEYRLEARWIPYEPPKRIVVPNVLGDKNEELCPGAAEFMLNGKPFRLEPIREGQRLFFIFRDETSGRETYGGGRFLYADLPAGGKVILDFNQAVNPPCAFTPYATCPLPPLQNRLPVRIEAGELRYGHP